MSDVKTDFTTGPILPQLFKFSIPLLGALLLQAAYGAVDLLIVGQFGDATGVSAVSIGSQIMQFFTGMIMGLAAGSMISLAQFVGAGDDKRAAGTVGMTIVIFAIVAVVVTAVLVCIPNQLAAVMQAPPEAFAKTAQYVFVCGIGTVFIVAYNVIGNIMRALGVTMFVLAFWFGDLLAAIFTHDAGVIALAATYLKAYAIDCILVCPLFNLLGFFNGCGRTTFVMLQGLVQSFAVRLPLAVIFSQLPNTSLFLIGLAYPIASVFGIVLCLIYFKMGRWKRGLAEFEKPAEAEALAEA